MNNILAVRNLFIKEKEVADEYAIKLGVPYDLNNMGTNNVGAILRTLRAWFGIMMRVMLS
jgi:hypothetical protein